MCMVSRARDKVILTFYLKCVKRMSDLLQYDREHGSTPLGLVMIYDLN